MPSFMALIFVLVVAALVLWAISQFPLDATIVKIIRVIVIVAACIYALRWLMGAFGGGSLGGPLRF